MVLVEEPSLRDKVRVFRDRFHAGRVLAEKLREYEGVDAIVLAVPAGGVPVGVEVSKRLGLQFDLMMVRKLHIPWDPEAGFGAVSWDGVTVFNEELLQFLGLGEEEVAKCVELERAEIERRIKVFRAGKPWPSLEGRVTIFTDDGVASGYTMLAAVESAKRRGAGEVVVAVPTGSIGAVKLLESRADKVLCLNVRSGRIFAVADAYKWWHDLSDEEVLEILKKAGFFTKSPPR